MKTKIFILGIVFIVSNLFSQQWIPHYNFSINNPGYSVIQTQFLNADLGYARIKNSNTIKILKTINRGSTWNEVTLYNIYIYEQYAKTYMYFINELTGFRSHIPPDKVKHILDKTTDGGITWIRKINTTGIVAVQPLIGYSTTQGYYFMLDEEYSPHNIKVYRSTDGFETYSVVYNQFPAYQNDKFRFLNIKSFENGEIACVGYVQRGSNTDYFRLETNTEYPYIPLISYGPDPNNYLKFEYITKINNNFNYLGTQENVPGGFSGTRFYFDLNENSSLISTQYYPERVGGLSFSSDSKGFALIDDKVYLTQNSGQNWSQDGSMQSSITIGQEMLKSFGDVCYAVTSPGNFHVRRIAGNYNTMFDWQGGTNWSIAIDGENVPTSGSGYFRGGSVALYANQFQINSNYDTTARFYYWGGNCNASMNYSSNSYLINSGSNINADYKTMLKSTTSGALLNANQVKALKDTNGVTNLIYESMGGIFFTRTKSNGTFKAEEVLSSSAYNPLQGYATFNNKNPYLSENKNTNNTETNMWACWERREGSNIKIMSSARIYDENNPPPPSWPKHYWGTAELLTLSGVPDLFECFPKIFVAGGSANPLRVLTYLKPDGNNKKIVGRVYTTNSIVQEFDITLPGNIAEYAVVSIYPSYGITFQLHIAYRKDQTVYYKSVRIGQLSIWNGTYAHYEVIDQDVNISTDNSSWRAALDIALKNTANSSSSFNMQPVVTYQGKKNVRIIIERDGQPSEIITNNYPIYVKERLPSGDWSSVIVSYNNPNINEPQMNPTIIGSKHKNSCIVSYGKGYSAPYTFMQKVHLWNGSISSGYNCNPISYPANDVKIVKGGLIDDGTPSLSQKMMTLSYQSANLYNVGHQALNITYGIGGDDGFEEISGLIEANYVQYTFNLGNILVNNQNINFANNLDTVIDNIGELNNNLASKTFLLNENDTLIIGRNASYVINDPNAAPANIEYWVKLMNKTTNSMHRLLAHDTIHTADSVQYEFLEGYIIRDIPNGSDSFYVQLEIDTVDGIFGIGGGIGGDGDGGDNIQIKRKIYWENEKITHETSNIPKSFNLYQNFPNPFNPATVIKYDLPKDVKVTVKIYDLLGREVTTLVNNEFKNAGRYELNWNAGNYASGVYIYRIEVRQAGSSTVDYISTKKMVLLK